MGVQQVVVIAGNNRPGTFNKVDDVLKAIPAERLLEYVVKNVPTEDILTALEADNPWKNTAWNSSNTRNSNSPNLAPSTQKNLGTQPDLGKMSYKELMQYKKDQAVKLYMTAPGMTLEKAGQAFGLAGATVGRELKRKRDEYRRAWLIRHPGEKL